MNGRMNPRERYYAEMRAAEERRRELARRAEEEARRRELAERRRRHMEMLERRRQRERMMRKRRRIAFAGRFFLFLVCFCLIFAAVALCVFISFQMRPIHLDENKSYTYVYGDGKDRIKEKVSAARLTRGGVRYVDFTSLSEYLSLTVMGGAGSYRFVIPGGAEEVSFTDGSDEALVNGEIYRMKGKAEANQSGVWVPLSFVRDCMTGITVTEDEEALEIVFTSSGGLGFIMKKFEPLDPIRDESAVTDDVTDVPETGADSDEAETDTVPDE